MRDRCCSWGGHEGGRMEERVVQRGTDLGDRSGGDNHRDSVFHGTGRNVWISSRQRRQNHGVFRGARGTRFCSTSHCISLGVACREKCSARSSRCFETKLSSSARSVRRFWYIRWCPRWRVKSESAECSAHGRHLKTAPLQSGVEGRQRLSLGEDSTRSCSK